MLKPIGPALADVVAKAEMTAPPFTYQISQMRPRAVLLEIDACVAEILDVAPRQYFYGGSDAWGDAVREAQRLRGLFEESWADAFA